MVKGSPFELNNEFPNPTKFYSLQCPTFNRLIENQPACKKVVTSVLSLI